MNILVTGGAGYIGSVTVDTLINQGHNVAVIDNLDRGHKKAVHPKAVFYEDNIASSKSVENIIRKHNIEYILHFAADSQVGESMVNPVKYFRNNNCAGLELASTAAKCGIKKFIFSSTAATYGEPETIPITESHPNKPTNTYGESKLVFEKYLKWIYTAHGMEFVSLRYFNACGASESYGEDHTPETHIIPIVLEAASGERDYVDIFGDDYPTFDGTCIRDYVHVCDLASAHILALKTQGCAIYNLGIGRGFSVKEVIQAAITVTGKKIETKISARREGDPAMLVASSDKIRNELGWKPRFESLESMIETAWRWKQIYPHGYGD